MVHVCHLLWGFGCMGHHGLEKGQEMNDVDPTLLKHIQQAVNTNLMAVVRNIVAGTSMTPKSAISLVREQLDNIEILAGEEDHEVAVDGALRSTAGERAEAEAALVAEVQEGGQSADVRGERPAGHPRRTEAQPDNQATLHGRGVVKEGEEGNYWYA
jgi:hypothetical protein